MPIDNIETNRHEQFLVSLVTQINALLVIISAVTLAKCDLCHSCSIMMRKQDLIHFQHGNNKTWTNCPSINYTVQWILLFSKCDDDANKMFGNNRQSTLTQKM